MATSPTEISAESILVAKNIRMHRAAKQLTMRDVEEASGMPRAIYSRIERGEREITFGQLVLVAKALDVNPNALLDGVIDS